MIDFDAGSYGPYLWPAFIVTLVAFAGMIIDTAWRARHWKDKAGDDEDAAP